MEAKTKSGTFLVESCGRASNTPSSPISDLSKSLTFPTQIDFSSLCTQKMAVYLHSFKNVELILFDFENNIGKILKKKRKNN